MARKIRTLGGYIHEYQKSILDPEAFWTQIADTFYWQKKWDSIVEWEFETPSVKWFVNAKLNITENIFERYLHTKKNKPAIIWEPNDPNEPSITLSYKELYEKTCQFANVLIKNGVGKGDRVIIYMPMVPEAAIAMLACARVGAIHSVVFAGFSATSLSDRINDCEAKMVLTSDGNFRGSKVIPVKKVVDEAVENTSSIERVIVLERTKTEVTMKPGRDLWWHEELEGTSFENTAEVMDSEDMLFILYTSGSTGKPKGVVHTCGGYMVYTYYTFKNVFQYSYEDIYWCTADVGWIRGECQQTNVLMV